MRAWKPRERLLAGATATVVAGGLLFQAVLQPVWARAAGLGDEVEGLEVSLTRMRANVRMRDQIEGRYEQLKGLMRESGSASQEMPRFARLLTEICGPLGLQMRSIRPLPDADEGFYRKYALALEMEGPMPELAKFLSAVARAEDPIRVERMELMCKDRPDVVTAHAVVTKVAATSRPAGEERHWPGEGAGRVSLARGGER
jgi:Tfp pilus assembly protein PilO